MADKKIGIGMIGAGFIGQLGHLMNYADMKDCRVVALAEFRPELRKKAAARYGIPRAYATHRQLLKDPAVDAVVVVTPRAYTAPTVLDCLNAGKHVLSEKPMAGTLEQAETLVAAAKKKKLVYSVGYMKRHDEGVQAAKKLLDETIRSGALGPVTFARAHCFMGDSYAKAGGHVTTDEKAEYADGGWPTAPSWLPAQWAKAFAMYVNTYSHNVNLLRYLFGKTPDIEHVNLTRRPAQLVSLDFGGFLASLETGRSTCREWDETTDVYFADGRLSIRTPPGLLKNVPAQVELYQAGNIQQTLTLRTDWTWAFRRQAEAFVADVRAKRAPLASGADSLEDMRLIEGMWRRELAHLDAAAAAARGQ